MNEQTMWTPWGNATPPYVGWFPASRERNGEALRYWNGERWSAWCHVESDEAQARAARATPDPGSPEGIEWRTLSPAAHAWLDAECPGITECGHGGWGDDWGR